MRISLILPPRYRLWDRSYDLPCIGLSDREHDHQGAGEDLVSHVTFDKILSRPAHYVTAPLGCSESPQRYFGSRYLQRQQLMRGVGFDTVWLMT